MKCPECYSENPRITPLREPEQCLKEHTQYVCSLCGRCICINNLGDWRYRWKFPYSSLEEAKLYLKVAEIVSEDVCGIYSIQSSRGRVSYKIFHLREDLFDYLSHNKDKTCLDREPLYVSEAYMPILPKQIRRLSKEEAERYLEEQRNARGSKK